LVISNGIKFIPSFVKTRQIIQKLKCGTHGQRGHLISRTLRKETLVQVRSELNVNQVKSDFPASHVGKYRSKQTNELWHNPLQHRLPNCGTRTHRSTKADCHSYSEVLISASPLRSTLCGFYQRFKWAPNKFIRMTHIKVSTVDLYHSSIKNWNVYFQSFFSHGVRTFV
jgi:hypothetical protein